MKRDRQISNFPTSKTKSDARNYELKLPADKLSKGQVAWDGIVYRA